MMTQFPMDKANMKSIIQEFDKNEVSLEKVVHVVTSKLELANKYAPIVMYEEPFDFYVTTSSEGSVLKFSAQELLESCNNQSCEGVPCFLDIDDMMNELSECLGGDALSLVVKELKQNDQILSCLRKF